MDKKSYRVRNWSDYNEALVQRGSITFWINEEITTQWTSAKKLKKRGRPEKYSDIAIEAGLTLRALYKMTFRATEGFINSLMSLLKVGLRSPDYTLLCKRQKNLSVKIHDTQRKSNENLHLVIDTTGLKVYGEGEWKVRQHGWVKHRLWRKLHLAINEKGQTVEAFELTDLGVQDCEGLPLLLGQIDSVIDSTKGDGAYDRFSCYEEAEKRKCHLVTPPQRNARTSVERRNKVKKKASANAIKKRDEAVEQIRKLGRKDWKVKTGYHRRSLAETAMFRIKTLLGNRLTTRDFANQKTEMAIWCRIINKMTSLGMPQAVAVS